MFLILPFLSSLRFRRFDEKKTGFPGRDKKVDSNHSNAGILKAKCIGNQTMVQVLFLKTPISAPTRGPNTLRTQPVDNPKKV